METEKDLKNFFFVIANNPLYYTPHYQSLLIMVDKYLESLKLISKTSNYQNYAKWLMEGLLVKTGRGRALQILAPLVLTDDYKDGLSYFTENELNSFAVRRMAFIKIIEQIASGSPLTEVNGMDAIIVRASEMQPSTYFNIPTDNNRSPISIRKIYPSWPEGVVHGSYDSDEEAKKADYKELIGITRLGFLSLILFLQDRGQDRIKKCPNCGEFFSARSISRQICYKSKCKKEYHRKDMRSRRERDPVRYC